jgi:hypothetical protein
MGRKTTDVADDQEPEVQEITINDFKILDHYYVDKVDKVTGETYKCFECPLAVLLGRRRSGKSVKLISLLSECKDVFGTAYLFSPTAFGTGVFGTIFKHAFCYRQPDVELIKAIQALQDFLKERAPSFLTRKDLICLIVLDDCGSLAFMKSAFLAELACNCRNSNISLWFTLQNFNQVTPVVRENCLASGTLVTMADGTLKPIERVPVGSTVLARGPKGLVPRKVTAVLDKGVQRCLELLFEDGRTLKCTANHRILTVTSDPEGGAEPIKRWVEAQHLAIGDSHVCISDKISSVDDVTVATHKGMNDLPTWHTKLVGRRDIETQQVWDLSVPVSAEENAARVANGEAPLNDDYHSFVAEGVVVHNCDIFLTNLTSNINIQRKMFSEFFSCFGTLECFVAALQHCAQRFGSMVWRNAGEHDDIEHSVFRYRCTNTNANSFSLDVPLQGLIQELFGKTEAEKAEDALKELNGMAEKMSKLSGAEAEVDEDMELDPDEEDLVGMNDEDDQDYAGGVSGNKQDSEPGDDSDPTPKKKKTRKAAGAAGAKEKPKKKIKSSIVKGKGGKAGVVFATNPIEAH